MFFHTKHNKLELGRLEKLGRPYIGHVLLARPEMVPGCNVTSNRTTGLFSSPQSGFCGMKLGKQSGRS